MPGIRVQARATAPLGTTWPVLAGQAAGQRGRQRGKVTLEREGDPPPDGAGADPCRVQPPLKIRERSPTSMSPRAWPTGGYGACPCATTPARRS